MKTQTNPLFLSLALLSALLLPTMGSAYTLKGGMDGGGGDAVVCFDNIELARSVQSDYSRKVLDKDISHITSVETYDLYQMRKGLSLAPLSDDDLIKLDPGEKAQDYPGKIARHLEYRFPRLAQIILSGEKNMQEDGKVFFHDSALVWQDTARQVVHLEDECVLVSMAAQEDLGDYSDTEHIHRYKLATPVILHLDRRLFEHPTHSELSKGMLYLHEYVYAIARIWGKDESSKNTRRLLGLMANKNLNLSLEELADYAELLNVNVGRSYLQITLASAVHGLIQDHIEPDYYRSSLQNHADLVKRIRNEYSRWKSDGNTNYDGHRSFWDESNNKYNSSLFVLRYTLQQEERNSGPVPAFVAEINALIEEKMEYATQDLEAIFNDKWGPELLNVPLRDKDRQRIEEVFVDELAQLFIDTAYNDFKSYYGVIPFKTYGLDRNADAMVYALLDQQGIKLRDIILEPTK